uniref:Large ribosomal subunit protein uL23c n=1 Tax=Pityrogramma trifoliata TaxID=164275 RepID=A0A3G5CQY6_9MONI|nr:ribosomal protein L23 [Pityrogramma trifoliata]AYW15268.1 ribosomal protein L23 [Pityrogramma trifoliata]
MDKSKNQIITEKSIRLLQQNQYTFKVDSKLTKTEMKNWIEGFFNVKIKGINSIRIQNKNIKNKASFSKKMVIKLRKNYYIPLFLNQS